MRVICIDDEPESGYVPSHPWPKLNSIYTVIDEMIDENNDLWYCLLELGEEWWFDATAFRPIDEDEEEQIYQQETEELCV